MGRFAATRLAPHSLSLGFETENKLTRPQLRDWTLFSKHPRPDEALKAGDLQRALTEFGLEQMLELRNSMGMTSDGPGVGFGATLWLLGDYEGAGYVWAQISERVFKGRYSHSNQKTFQGPLLLWFASVKLESKDWHDLATRTFQKLLRNKLWRSDSVAELALFLQKEVDLAFLESKFTEPMRERQFPKALFYAGVRAIEEGNKSQALEYWDRVTVPNISLWELEYYLALHERQRLREELNAQQAAQADRA